MGGWKQSLFIAAKHYFVLLAVVASPSLQKIEFARNGLSFVIGEFGDIFEGDEHIFSHNCFLSKRNLFGIIADCLGKRIGSQLNQNRFF